MYSGGGVAAVRFTGKLKGGKYDYEIFKEAYSVRYVRGADMYDIGRNCVSRVKLGCVSIKQIWREL